MGEGVSPSLARVGVPGTILLERNFSGGLCLPDIVIYAFQITTARGQHLRKGVIPSLPLKRVSCKGVFIPGSKRATRDANGTINATAELRSSVYISSDPQGSAPLCSDPVRLEKGTRPKKEILGSGDISFQLIRSVSDIVDAAITVSGDAGSASKANPIPGAISSGSADPQNPDLDRSLNGERPEIRPGSGSGVAVFAPGHSEKGVRPEKSFNGALTTHGWPTQKGVSPSLPLKRDVQAGSLFLACFRGKINIVDGAVTVAIIPGVDVAGAWCVVRGACIAGSDLSKKEAYQALFSIAATGVSYVARKSNSADANLGGRSSPLDYKSRLLSGFQEGSVRLGMKDTPTPPEIILPMCLRVPVSTCVRSSKGFLKSWNVLDAITTDLQGYDLPDLNRDVRCWFEGSPDLFEIGSGVRVVRLAGAGCTAQAYGGVMAVFWNPFLVKSVLVGTEHCAMAIPTISNSDSEPEDAAVAGNASTRCGYDGRFGRLDGKLVHFRSR